MEHKHVASHAPAYLVGTEKSWLAMLHFTIGRKEKSGIEEQDKTGIKSQKNVTAEQRSEKIWECDGLASGGLVNC